jgi:hypothetical protein
MLVSSVFDTLREQFPASIYLMHPQNDLPFSICTDASQITIAGELMQLDSAGNLNITSTKTRILSPAERLFTVCEQELFAIVHALKKFKIYVFGRKVTVHAHKALSFPKRCALTSNRVARCVLQIQDCDPTSTEKPK